MQARGAPEGELLTSSGKERERLVVIRAAGDHLLRQSEAAKRLGLSVRQVKRLVAAFRRQGAKGLVSKRRRRASNRRIDSQRHARFVELVRGRYADFGPALAAEYLGLSSRLWL